MPNLKVLIKSDKGKTLIQTTTAHKGSNEYNWLIEQGYEVAVTVKGNEIKSFIESKFFGPRDKYQRPEN